ncbi:MAG: DUF3768 domain-containing protein [Crocinitomicaceae bacterium]
MTSPSGKIAALNDIFRTSWDEAQTGHIVKTRGIQALPEEDQKAIFNLVKTFNTFSEDNDPYGEHDFGKVEHNGNKVFWKFDYYDKTLTKHTEDATDPEKTTRVMTIMLSSEY